MSNKDKNFHVGCFIAFLIGVIILLLCEYTELPIVKSFAYFAWVAVIVGGIMTIYFVIKLIFGSKNNKDDKNK